MKNPTYHINTPAVVSELIDGELVIMNLETGAYYSAESVGASVWQWIEQGLGRSDMVPMVSSHFENVSGDFEADLDIFIAKLLENMLIKEGNDAAPRSDLPSAEGELKTYQTPDVMVYTDMKDMLLLDPIHDVDETGWPKPNNG